MLVHENNEVASSETSTETQEGQALLETRKDNQNPITDEEQTN